MEPHFARLQHFRDGRVTVLPPMKIIIFRSGKLPGPRERLVHGRDALALQSVTGGPARELALVERAADPGLREHVVRPAGKQRQPRAKGPCPRRNRRPYRASGMSGARSGRPPRRCPTRCVPYRRRQTAARPAVPNVHGAPSRARPKRIPVARPAARCAVRPNRSARRARSGPSGTFGCIHALQVALDLKRADRPGSRSRAATVGRTAELGLPPGTSGRRTGSARATPWRAR